MRRFIESMGEQFTKTELVSAMSLVISGLAIIRSYDLMFIEISSLIDIIWMGIGLVFFVLICISISHAIGFGLIAWSKNIPAAITVEAMQDLDRNSQEFNVNDKTMTHRFFASLKIFNREYSELTNCYAVLSKAKIVSPRINMPESLNALGKKLRWKENHGEDKCEVSISPRTGMAILHVYQFSLLDDNASTTIAESDFDICETGRVRTIRHIFLPVSIKYEVQIEIHGKLKGDDVKIKPFIGYIDYVVSQNENTFNFPIRIYEGKHLSNN